MLTDITIRKLLASPPPKRVEHAAGKVAGLFFITQPSGATSWALRYRAAGATRKLTLGSFPSLDLKAPRRAAEEARGQIARAKDPAAAKTAVHEAAKAERVAEGDKIEASSRNSSSGTQRRRRVIGERPGRRLRTPVYISRQTSTVA
jgi:Arm domain-containing DNA-binding protein